MMRCSKQVQVEVDSIFPPIGAESRRRIVLTNSRRDSQNLTDIFEFRKESEAHTSFAFPLWAEGANGTILLLLSQGLHALPEHPYLFFQIARHLSDFVLKQCTPRHRSFATFMTWGN